MNNSYYNTNNTMVSYKQLSFILTILLLLFTFSFACSPAVNPTDNNTVFMPTLHIKVSDGSTDITDSLSIGVNNSNLISITGLSNAVADKTYTLTIAPVAGSFSTPRDNPITITITEPQDFSPEDGVLSPSNSFSITNVNDESKPISYTVVVPFSGAPVENWLTSNSLSTYITATFASQAASLTLSENTLSVNDLVNADSGTGSISFTLPTGFVANPDSIPLPDPDGSAIAAASMIPSSATFTISETDNTKNTQTYTIDTISLAAITAFIPGVHFSISDDSSSLPVPGLSIGVDENDSTKIIISGLINSIGADKTYTLTIAPVTGVFSTQGDSPVTITITEPPDFSPGDGVLSLSDSFTITNDSDSNPIRYTVVVPFTGAAVEDWLTSDSLSTYITATFASQAAILTLSGNALSVNDLTNAIDGTGSIEFTTLPSGFVASPNPISLTDPDGAGTDQNTITLSPDTFTISETDNSANSQTYTVNPINLNRLIVFTADEHIVITDDTSSPVLGLSIGVDENDSTKIVIRGSVNSIAADKTYTLTIAPVTGVFSTQGDSPVTITITEPPGFSPGDGVLSPSDSFTITNNNDPSNSIRYTVVVPFSGAEVEEWLTETTFATYFTGATYAGQTLDSGALSFNFDGDSIAIDGSTIINLQDGSLQLRTTNIADGYTLTQNLNDPDGDGEAALTDADAGSIIITEEGNTANTKTYTVTISLAAYTSPVEASHITAMFNGITAKQSNIEISGVDIIISGFPNIAGSGGTGTVTITQPTTDEFTIDSNPLSLSFTDPDGTNSQDIEAGTVSVTSAGVTVLHTIIIRFSTLIELEITSDYVENNPLTIISGGTVTITGLGACELLPPPTIEIVGNTSATVRTFPSYFDRRIDSSDGSFPYTVNRVLIIEDANGVVLDEYFTVNIEGFPACDDATIFTNTANTGDDADNAFEIDSAHKLELLSQLVRSDNANYASKSYKLTADIDLGLADLPWSEAASGETGEGFPPIGVNDTTSFQGTFDCADFSITGLYINKANDDNIGLFGNISGASIQNCSLINVNVTGLNLVGGLVGILGASSSITNSYVTGSVSGTGNGVGGLVGFSFTSNITNSYATGSVSGTDNVGGLVGYLYFSSIITNTYATGSVSGNENVGGLVGYLQTFSGISNSYATGSVSGTTHVGGFAGYLNSSSITNSYATGSVTGTETVGLFIGFNSDSQPIVVYTGVTDSYYNNEAVLTVGDTVLAAKGVGSDGDTDDTTTMNLTGLDKSALQVAKGTTSGEPYSTWPEDAWLFMAGQYPRLIPVACPNRQYPADPSNVPTDCTAL